MEDQNITVHCRTVSFPAASITLTRKADGVEFRSPNGTFHLLNLKSVDKGTYVVNFTNELGYEVQTFELIVKGKVLKLKVEHSIITGDGETPSTYDHHHKSVSDSSTARGMSSSSTNAHG